MAQPFLQKAGMASQHPLKSTPPKNNQSRSQVQPANRSFAQVVKSMNNNQSKSNSSSNMRLDNKDDSITKEAQKFVAQLRQLGENFKEWQAIQLLIENSDVEAGEILANMDWLLQHNQFESLQETGIAGNVSLLDEENTLNSNGQMGSLSPIDQTVSLNMFQSLEATLEQLFSRLNVSSAEQLLLADYFEQLLNQYELINLAADDHEKEELYAEFIDQLMQLPLIDPKVDEQANLMNDNQTFQVLQQWNKIMSELSAMVREHMRFGQSNGHLLSFQGALEQNGLLAVLNEWTTDDNIQLQVLKNASDADKERLLKNLLNSALTKSNHSSAQLVAQGTATGLLKNVSTDTNESLMIQRLQGEQLSSETVQNKEATKQQMTARYQHLVNDLQQIMKLKFQHLKNGDMTQMRINLHPAQLGHLDIRVTQVDGKMIAQIFTATKIAHEALDRQIHQLRTALVQQGLQVERVEVSQQPNLTHQQHQDERTSQQFLKERESKKNRSSNGTSINEEKGEDSIIESYPQSIDGLSQQINYSV